MTAVHEHCSKEVLQAIIDYGAEVNATNKKGNSALKQADDRRHTDAVMVLLKAGAKPYHREDIGTLYLELICFLIAAAIMVWFVVVGYISPHEFLISFIVWDCLGIYCFWDGFMFAFFGLENPNSLPVHKGDVSMASTSPLELFM